MEYTFQYIKEKCMPGIKTKGEIKILISSSENENELGSAFACWDLQLILVFLADLKKELE